MKSIVTSLFILLNTLCFAQITAITSKGDEVVLYDNGTWKYAGKEAPSKPIEENKTPFVKSKDATFPLQSKTVSATVNIDPKKWTFKKGEEGAASEYQFQMKASDAYAMLITERIEIPIESLKQIAIDNAKNVAPDIEVVKQDYRMVNGTKVLFMQMNGTIQGIKFSYLGYYYSNPAGTVQFITYTAQNLLPDYQGELMTLLNGIEFTK
ncbi:MAG TPA: hypothetical protein VIM65_10355 [Cyclobacteriaceae bacterium]